MISLALVLFGQHDADSDRARRLLPLGDDIGDDDAALGEFFKLKKAARDRARRPKVDETLYFL